MKNLLLLVCIFFLSTTGWSQQFFMPQGTSNNVYPFGSTTSNKVQWLYHPTDFVTAPGTGNITKLYFKTWNGAASYSATYGNFSIRMANTALNVFPNTTFITPTTLVFSGNPVVVAATPQFTWFSFTLQTPFAYTGQNIIVEIQQNSLTGSITANCTQIGAISNARRIYGTYGSTTGIGADYSVGDLGFDMCDDCDPPKNFQANNVTLHSADLTWDAINCASGYEYVIDQTPADPPSTGYATVLNPALSLANLPDGTCYYVHIRTQCGGPYDTSSWMLDSFCTVKDCKIPDVTIESITSTTAIARWDAVPGALGYEYSVGTTPDTPVKGHNTIYTNVKLMGLMPNAPLYFFLKAKCTPTPQSPWGTTPFHTSAHTSVEDIDNSAVSVFAYPNPVKDQVTIEVVGNSGQNPVARLTDMTGKIIAVQKMEGKTQVLGTANLPPGLYYLEYTDDANKQVIKINKQ